MRDVGVIFISVIPEHMLRIKFMSISYQIALRWMEENAFDGTVKSLL